MSIDVKFEATGVKTLQNRFRTMIRRAPVGAQKAVEKLGVELLAEVRRQYFAAGLQVETGAYLSGLTLDIVQTATGATATAGSSAPQAARLEYGFMGVDSLGRHYAQPPFPHWRPALMIIGQRAPREVYGSVIGEIRAS